MATDDGEYTHSPQESHSKNSPVPTRPDEHLIERGFWVYDEFCRKGVLE